MILADKIIRLRKKNGWSQEDLADKMSVSRQAVSKWEGAQTIPDLEKILQLSVLFGVTTDYLLKDEIEDEELTNDTSSDTTVKRISIEEANAYIEQRKKAAWGLSPILCKHCRAVQNRAKIFQGGSGASCCRLAYKITAV